jgi:two-component system response regulator YesN
MRVLLADDSSLILERLQEMISIHKQVEIVGTYKNGTDALSALRILKPDLAIVDIKMDGLTGLDILNEIRKENKTLKFIIFSFHASDYYRQLAIQSNADYFFSKVDDFEKLTEVVADMVLRETIIKASTSTTDILNNTSQNNNY